MREQFLVSAFSFHLVLCALGWALLMRWRRRLAAGPFAWRLAVADAAAFGAAMVVLAIVASAFVTPRSPFTVIRLVSQALFGESVVFSAALAGMVARSTSHRWSAALAVVPAALLAVYWDAYHHEPTDLRVSHHDVDVSPGGSGTRRLRILHLTDLQTDRIGDYEERAFQRGMDEKPDLIVMTGDYIQPRLSPTRAKATADLKALLRRRPLAAPLGVYAVRGDTDPDWPHVLAGTGIVPLTGDIARVPLPGGGTLSLVGLTIRMSRGQDDRAMLRLLAGAPDDDLRLVIGHNPSFVSALAGRVRVDLALAGHTHGGQVALPIVGAPYTKIRLPARYASGLRDYEGVPLHVSRGIGMERGTAPQIRFLGPPEICVVDVRYGGRRWTRSAPAERLALR